MSSSRREIPVPSEDDVTGLVAIKGDWNRYLFQHCVPQAWADLLEAVAKCASPNTESKFVALVQSRTELKIESASIAEYRLWPLGDCEQAYVGLSRIVVRC
ncbi:hypothetical protein BC936DRAFT_146693 [Jimgerdemannia flammicorona]|uniref:Uncharacterized protein n=1 Tax=Jimgerdemannia flammicorona TaxID=994334 RepID=A0A433D6Z6_9FUNG|nr:hypothetical protein BC936DRAFT_146693 [Jimgerdemannia flammicorona]